MLENERSFDALFCDLFETRRFRMFYNSIFSDDPVFNHSVISPEILDSQRNDVSEHSDIFIEIRAEANKRRVPPSIFVERFWRNSTSIMKSAIDYGYLISGTMELHSKNVNRVSKMRSESSFEVLEAKDVGPWNEVFMRSYGIGASWKRELIRRENLFQNRSSTYLFLASEKNDQSATSGCILLHNDPKDWMGIYCVGTLPEKRNLGVATAMVTFAETFAAKKGCNYLTLQTITSDHVAPLYQSLGFKVDFVRDVLISP